MPSSTPSQHLLVVPRRHRRSERLQVRPHGRAKTARLVRLGDAGVDQRLLRRVPIQLRLVGHVVEIQRVGHRVGQIHRPGGHAASADEVERSLVFGVAQAQHTRQGFGQAVFALDERGPRRRAHGRILESGLHHLAEVAGPHAEREVVQVVGGTHLVIDVQYVETGLPVRAVRGAGQPKLLAELSEVLFGLKREIRVGAGVHVLAVALVNGKNVGNGSERQRIAQVPGQLRGHAGYRPLKEARLVVAPPKIVAVRIAVTVEIRAGTGVVEVLSVRNALAQTERVLECRVMLIRVAAAVVLGRVKLEPRSEGVGRLERQLQAQRARVCVAQVRAVIVLEQPVAPVNGTGQPGLHGLADRAAHRTFHPARRVVAEGEPAVALQFLGGRGADVLQQPAGGVAAEQRPLGTAQNLDPLDVEQLGVRPADRADIGVVDEHRDGRFVMVREIVLRDAANVDRGVAGVKLDDVQARGLLGDFGGRGVAEFANPFAAERGDRKAHVLQRLFALLRRDHDFFQRRLLCAGRSAAEQDQHGGESRGLLAVCVVFAHVGHPSRSPLRTERPRCDHRSVPRPGHGLWVDYLSVNR